MAHAATQKAVVLVGPTGSGKSALALRLAQAQPTVIINADAMQMVSGLRILTARPSAHEEQAAPHALYGVLDPRAPTSVARWLALVEPVLRTAWAQGQQPLIVGGTGMYIRALIEGLAAVPAIDPGLRARIRSWPQAELHPALVRRDPVMAARLKPGDTQRLARALEVIESTGVSLAHWQAQRASPLFPEAQYELLALELPRPELYRRIDARFHTMLARGALAEVREFLHTLGEAPADLPILKAHGLPELREVLEGRITLEEATRRAQQHTRNYAKRQITWIRNQFPAARSITA